jgi:ketosteroid isomerase-like protein
LTHPNEDLIRGFFDALDRGDLEDAKTRMAADVRFHLGGGHRLAGERLGPDAWFALAREVISLTGDTFGLTVHDVLANDEHGVALVSAHAERDGESFDWNRVFVYHLTGGKMAEVWVHESDQALVDRLFA